MINIDLDSKKTFTFILSALVGLICLTGVFIFIPILIQSEHYKKDFMRLEKDKVLAEDLLKTYGAQNTTKHLTTEDELSQVISKVAGKGSSLNISILGIDPKDALELSVSGYKKVPVEMTLESGYKDFGRFLEYLGDFSDGVLLVTGFTIEQPQAETGKLRIVLQLEVYVSNG